jgi:hypothetical protein
MSHGYPFAHCYPCIQYVALTINLCITSAYFVACVKKVIINWKNFEEIFTIINLSIQLKYDCHEICQKLDIAIVMGKMTLY